MHTRFNLSEQVAHGEDLLFYSALETPLLFSFSLYHYPSGLTHFWSYRYRDFSLRPISFCWCFVSYKNAQYHTLH